MVIATIHAGDVAAVNERATTAAAKPLPDVPADLSVGERVTPASVGSSGGSGVFGRLGGADAGGYSQTILLTLLGLAFAVGLGYIFFSK